MALSARYVDTWYITDRSGAMLAGPFDGRAESFRDGFIYINAGMSDLRDGTYNAYYTLYDREGNRVLPDVYREIIPFDGRFLVRQDACAGLLDEQGNWVIKTPIYDYLNDRGGKIMKRSLVLIALILLCAVIAACGNNAPAATASPSDSSPESVAPAPAPSPEGFLFTTENMPRLDGAETPSATTCITTSVG
jgi:hypothetical protein